MNRFSNINIRTVGIKRAVALRTVIMKWLVPPSQVKADEPVTVALIAAAATIGAAAIGAGRPWQLR
jgi:hypothetical protein